MKSKASATNTTKRTKVIGEARGSGGLQDDLLENVRDVLAAVRGLFENLVDLLPFHELDRILFRLEEVSDGNAVQAVGFVLEAVDLHADFQDRRIIIGEARGSGGLQDDLLENVRDVLAAVRGLFENLVEATD